MIVTIDKVSTTKYPLSKMGKKAGICWGADVSNLEKNIKRGIDCLSSGHGRLLEWVNIEMDISEVSARCMREYTRHIGGASSFLQESTRYVDCEHFGYYKPYTENQADIKKVYDKAMTDIQKAYGELVSLGMPKEDAANILPLGMHTLITDKRNLRNFIEMSHQRLCTRAYKEYRSLMKLILSELSKLSTEWDFIVKYVLIPKCEAADYCTEKKSCGIKPFKNSYNFSKEDIDKVIESSPDDERRFRETDSYKGLELLWQKYLVSYPLQEGSI